MFDDKAVREQNVHPPGLSLEEHFRGFEVLEVLVLALDQYLVIGAPEIGSPLFHCRDDRQELPILSIVVLFGRLAFSSVEIDYAKNAESVILIKDAGNCEAACIGLQNDRFLLVDMLEDRCYSKGLFELLKCEFGIPSPFPLP